MLAYALKEQDLAKLKYPLYVSPKLDGIRAMMVGGCLVSRKLRPIPNLYIRSVLEPLLPNGFDGELIIPGKKLAEINSAVMSADGEPEDFEYWVFDAHTIQTFNHRFDYYSTRCETLVHDNVTAVNQVLARSEKALLSFEENFLDQGYEGVMLRSPDSPYKFGRSTFKEHYLMKLKRYEDSEAEVVEVLEAMENTNAKEKDELGLTKRSKAKAGMVPKGIMGKLVVYDKVNDWRFEIGTGWDAAERAEIWSKRKLYVGKELTYKFTRRGMKDAPREAVFKCWRLD